jgi:glycosyltransferase involved in cell wall biosynthesis
VVAARNEAKNLSTHLEFLGDQDYPDYEIILVDDGSTDQTQEILERFKKDRSHALRHIHILRIPTDESRGKKHALSRGIERAGKKVILVTDADCVPASSQWIEIMASSFSRDKNTELVLGYGPYRKTRGSFLNSLIRYETLMTAVQYFSYALHGFPYMGVGRNMAYNKELFTRVGGFSAHRDLRSGDDDLFVHQAANGSNTALCVDARAFTLSEPPQSLGSWIRQKRRHITTASQYKGSQQLRLGLFYLSQLGFYLLAVVLIAQGTRPLLLSFLLLTRFSAYYLVVIPSAKRLGEKDLLALAPLYEISIIFMQLYLFVYNKFSPPKHW